MEAELQPRQIVAVEDIEVIDREMADMVLVMVVVVVEVLGTSGIQDRAIHRWVRFELDLMTFIRRLLSMRGVVVQRDMHRKERKEEILTMMMNDNRLFLGASV